MRWKPISIEPPTLSKEGFRRGRNSAAYPARHMRRTMDRRRHNSAEDNRCTREVAQCRLPDLCLSHHGVGDRHAGAKRTVQVELFPATMVQELLWSTGIRLAELPPQVLLESSFLPGKLNRDPADRNHCRHGARIRLHGHDARPRDAGLRRAGPSQRAGMLSGTAPKAVKSRGIFCVIVPQDPPKSNSLFYARDFGRAGVPGVARLRFSRLPERLHSRR